MVASVAEVFAALDDKLPDWMKRLLAGANPITAAVDGLQRGGRKTAATEAGDRQELSPEQQKAALDRRLRLMDQARADQERLLGMEREATDFRLANEQKIEDFRRRGAEIEEEKARLRLDIEERLFRQQQALAALQAQNERGRAQVGIEETSLDLLRLQESGDFAVDDSIIENVNQYIRIRDEGEADLRLKEKQFQLDAESRRRDLEKFALDVSKRVQQINQSINDYKRDVLKYELDTARTIEDFRNKSAQWRYDLMKREYAEAATNAERMRALGGGGEPLAGHGVSHWWRTGTYGANWTRALAHRGGSSDGTRTWQRHRIA